MRRNLDEVFEIYQSFLDSVEMHFEYTDIVTIDETGKEKAILGFSNGFTVELTNQQGVENTAELRCWWDNEENAVEISTLEQLNNEFNSRHS